MEDKMFQLVPTFKCSFNKVDLSSLLNIPINCKYLVCLCFRESRWGRGWAEEVVFVRNLLLKFSVLRVLEGK